MMNSLYFFLAVFRINEEIQNLEYPVCYEMVSL